VPIASASPVSRAKPELDVRRGCSAVYTLNGHLVFVSKYRRPLFTDPMLTSCEHLMREVCAGVGAEVREFQRGDGPRPALGALPAQPCPVVLINGLKGVFSPAPPAVRSHVRKYLWGKHFWSPS
jgi:putative transposase